MDHIDRVAMRDGLIGSDAYLEQLVWPAYTECAGSTNDVADAVLAELVEQWAPVRGRWEETGELG